MDEGTVRLLLEGRPGTGKTTVARRLVNLLQEAGVPVGGFTTAELRTGGRREGFLVEAASGGQAHLAHVDLPGPPRVGRYGVDLGAFERVALPALGDPGIGGVVVIDELSKMELASAAFRAAVLELLERDVAVVATVHRAHDRFTDALKRRPDVRVIRVSEATRDACPSSSWIAWPAPIKGRGNGCSVRPGGGGPGQAGGPRARLGPAGAPASGPLPGRQGPDPQLRRRPGGRRLAGGPRGQEQLRRPPAPGPGASPDRRQAAVHGRPPPGRRASLHPARPGTAGGLARRAASINGSARAGRRVAVDERQPLDLVVYGSVAVNRQAARVGKGGGFSDLELALLVEAGLIGAGTVVATTVHPLQVLAEALPATGHDVRLDLIVAGEEVIACRRTRRPPGILWGHLDPAKVAAIPALAARAPHR